MKQLLLTVATFIFASSVLNHPIKCQEICPKPINFEKVQSYTIDIKDIHYIQKKVLNQIGSYQVCMQVGIFSIGERDLLFLHYKYSTKECVLYAGKEYNNELTMETLTVEHPKLDKILISDGFDAAIGKYKLMPAQNWTVLQQRIYGNVSFQKNWIEYKNGFGDPPDGDFWIGVNNMHELTNDSPGRIKFVMRKKTGPKVYIAEYQEFQVANKSDDYRLYIAGFETTLSDAGNGMIDKTDVYNDHDGAKFSTTDRDNDISASHCSQFSGHSGWWFASCGLSNPNGILTEDRVFAGSSMYWWPLDTGFTLDIFKIFLVI